MERAIFAGGCFWGMEYYFKRATGVISTRVGYTGGHKKNPSYREVCSHTTGHAEAIEVTYDPVATTYVEIARLFFEIHDPTQVDRQGPDIGSQYRSEVFYLNDSQKEIAERLILELQAKGYQVATKVTQATEFWPAESYHQDYYTKTGGTPYCHRYTKRF
jgi:peptide methionine sulfoxide reductase msrA/msrB